jgi:probable rRNA maturation factor
MSGALQITVQKATRVAPVPAAALLRRAALAAAVGVSGEVTVRVVGVREGRRLNAAYRGRDYATNVLSFGYGEAAGPLLGDLVLCAPVVLREAQDLGCGVEAHFVHLVVHGMLHLQGHDHEDAAQAAIMEPLERQIVMGLGYADPYPDEEMPG